MLDKRGYFACVLRHRCHRKAGIVIVYFTAAVTIVIGEPILLGHG